MTIGERDFNYLQQLVRRHTGVVIAEAKEYLAEYRLGALAAQTGAGSVERLLLRLQTQPSYDLERHVVEAMTTNETSFFRDGAPFEALERTVLPALLEARRIDRSLTFWSCACSSGQEPFSVAILLHRAYAALLDRWDVRILGTDVSSEMLAQARRGRYSALEVSRGITAEVKARYFEPVDGEWQIRDDIRRLVELRQLNLADPLPLLPTCDVILLRNVLIYFDLATKTAVLERVLRYLKPDGYLFLGGAEATVSWEMLQPEQANGATYYRVRR
ncbi:MAG TPA: protein-glutamate O-methyltransferase CheR [Polyangia bacterium]|jgi:chemotaxis protein methyltransferase CheR